MKNIAANNNHSQHSPLSLPPLFALDERSFNLLDTQKFLNDLMHIYQQYLSQHPLFILEVVEAQPTLKEEQKIIILFRLLIASVQIFKKDYENKALTFENKVTLGVMINSLYDELRAHIPIASFAPAQDSPKTPILNSSETHDVTSDVSVIHHLHNLPNTVYEENIFPYLSTQDIMNLGTASILGNNSADKKPILQKFRNNENAFNKHKKASPRIVEPSYFQYQAPNYGLVRHPFFYQLKTELQNSIANCTNALSSQLRYLAITDSLDAHFVRFIPLLANTFFKEQHNEPRIKALVEQLKTINLELYNKFTPASLLKLCILIVKTLKSQAYPPLYTQHAQFLDLFFSAIYKEIDFSHLIKNMRNDKESFIKTLNRLIMLRLHCGDSQVIAHIFDEAILRMTLYRAQEPDELQVEEDDIFDINHLIFAYIRLASEIDLNHVCNNLEDSVLLTAFYQQDLPFITTLLSHKFSSVFSMSILKDAISNAKTSQQRQFIAGFIELLLTLKDDIDDLFNLNFTNTKTYSNSSDFFRDLIAVLKTNQFDEVIAKIEENIKGSTSLKEKKYQETLNILQEQYDIGLVWIKTKLKTLIFDVLATSERPDLIQSALYKYLNLTPANEQLLFNTVSFIDGLIAELSVPDDSDDDENCSTYSTEKEVEQLSGIKEAIESFQHQCKKRKQHDSSEEDAVITKEIRLTL